MRVNSYSKYVIQVPYDNCIDYDISNNYSKTRKTNRLKHGLSSINCRIHAQQNVYKLLRKSCIYHHKHVNYTNTKI